MREGVRLSIPQADSTTFRYFQHWRLAFSLLSVSKDTLFARRKHAALKGKVSSPYKYKIANKWEEYIFLLVRGGRQ